MFCLKTGKDIAIVENNQCGGQNMAASGKSVARGNKQAMARKYENYGVQICGLSRTIRIMRSKRKQRIDIF